jgi:hypothetical protein
MYRKKCIYKAQGKTQTECNVGLRFYIVSIEASYGENEGLTPNKRY